MPSLSATAQLRARARLPALAILVTLGACAEPPPSPPSDDDDRTPAPAVTAFVAPQATCAIGTCSHVAGVVGAALPSACSSCAAAVCAADAYCCTTSWDQQCVEAAARRCGCGPQPIDEDSSAPVTAYDLDGDGLAESLATGTCASGSGHCLTVTAGSAGLAGRQIVLDAAGLACPLQGGGGYPIKGRRFMALGDLAGNDGISEVSALYCGSAARPAVAVVNVATSTTLARALAPAGQKKAYVDFVRNPTGRLYPFLAPPLGDGDTTAPIWGYLCQYRPGFGANPCGTGFQQLTTTFAGAYRDSGGTLSDTNNDGWTDLNLIYHATIRTYSGANGALLATTTLDPANPALQVIEPGDPIGAPALSPTNFHAGRLYGVHGAGRTVQPAQSGKQRIAIIAGNQVGDFQDPDCNVSRYVSVLQHPAGQPSTRTLKWTRYFGFSVHNLTSDCNGVLRATDKLNGCVHRFSDGRVRVDGSEALAFNVSAQSTPITCLAEQQQVCATNFSQPALDAQFACQSQWLTQPATWSVRVLNETTGGKIVTVAGRYLWGYSDRVVPGKTVFLTQPVTAGASFDAPGLGAPTLDAHEIVGGVWTYVGTFPAAGRPLLRSVRPFGQRGVGSSTSFAELTFVDTGLGVGVQLDTGAVIAWNGASFVQCAGTACAPPPCTYAFSPAGASVAATATSGATSLSAGATCADTIVSDASWLTITTGAIGAGPRTVGYAIASNPGAARTASLRVGAAAFTVTQAAAGPTCTFTVAPTTASVGASATSLAIGVSVAAGCAWTATSNATWLTITAGATGSGNGTAMIAVAANASGARTGTATVAGTTVTITQAAGTGACTPGSGTCCGACGGNAGTCWCDDACTAAGDCCADKATYCSAAPCTFTVSPTVLSSISAAGVSSSVAVTTTAGCAWTATSTTPWLTITSGAGGSGNGTVTFAIAANTGAARTGTLTVAGQTVTVNQQAGAAVCTPSPSSCCQSCGTFAGACYCDAACVQFGDCCADKQTFCQ